MDQTLKPSLTRCTPRETSDRVVVIKKVFAPAGNQDKRSNASVVPYARMVRWSGGQRKIKLTYRVERTVRAYGTQIQKMEKTI